MKVDIIPAHKHRVATIQCELPFTYEELVADLEKEKWDGNDTIQQRSVNDWDGGRFKLLQPASQKLQDLQRFFSSTEWKEQWVRWMFDNIAGFDSDWGWREPEQMLECVHSHGEFTLDKPGFVNCLHTDFRRLVATGMVYFTCKDDPNVSSYFYDTYQRDNPVRIPTLFGSGWIHANGNDTWHEGFNKTESKRYSMLLGLTLNVTKIA